MVTSRRRIANDSDEESAPNKRIRLEDSFELIQSSDEEQEQDEDSQTMSQDDTPLPADTDGYVEGSIVKITLRNFVTYDYCEFSPGPQLNMIIGPNGTGKSTIVCAVALGLGGAPSLLGRAKNISEFVKTGEDEAMIQIELKRTGGKRNVVIQRNITKSNNASSWRLNGRHAPQKDVLAIVNQLNIQVDNLCQFLPQDKVAEFAQLTPPALLEKTQEAAGATDLLKWHQNLIEWKRDEIVKGRSFDEHMDTLKSYQDANAHLEKDVMKLRQREEILRHIKLLNAKLPLVRYTEAKDAYDRAKLVQQEKMAILERLKEENQPIEDAKIEYIQAVKKAQRKNEGLNAMIQELNRKIQSANSEWNASTNETKTIEGRIASIEQHKQKRLFDIKKFEERIANMTTSLGEEPTLEGIDVLTAAIEQIDQQIEDHSFEQDRATQQIRDNKRRLASINDELVAKEKEQVGLNDVAKIRANRLQSFQPDTMKAYQWLKENRHRFKRKIHGPLVLQIQLKDERYANLVESLLGGRYSTNLRAFVCETQEDYDLFTKEVVDNLNLRLTVSWPDKINQDRVKPMMSREDLQRNFGMDCFLSELLEGPKILIDYLCSETRINLVPLTLKNADERLLADSGKFRRFGIQDNLYEVKTYSYGRGGNQVQVRKCWVSDYLKNKVDTQAMSKVKDEIHSLTESKKELYMEAETIQNDYNKKRQRLTELRHEKDDKRQQKKDIIFQKQRWEKEKQKIESYEYQLEGLRNAPQDDNEMMDRYKDQLANQITRRAHLAGIYTDHLKNSTKCVLDRNVAQLELMQAKAKQNFVEDFSRRQSTALGQAEQGFRQAQAESRQKKAIAQRFQRDAEAAGRDLDDEQKEEFNAIKEKWHEEGLGQTVIELEDAIQAEKAKAETLKASNPNAMAQYEQRLGKIQMYQRKIDSEKQELDGIREKIEQVKSRWEPQLISLVGRISVSFGAALQRIGCAGEVCVAKEEDFEKWGIEIRVKFRDNEKLQLLTGQRQSGGERAVSTILYLMSLQNLAKSPFRVVDEINQGMDPRNERMIHEQIVKGASKPGTAQYFLITPKLLPDLFYNERMRVLCIYNGEWQPKRLKPIAEYLRHARSSASSSSRPISSASS